MRAMTACVNCGRELPYKAAFCSACGTDQRTEPAEPAHIGAVTPSRVVHAWNRREYVALAGAALVTIGSFSPVITSPVYGTMTYINNGHGDGVASLVLAVAVLLLVVFNLVRWAWVVGALTAALVGYDLVNVSSAIPGSSSNVQVGYGWALLLIGAALMAVASFLPDSASST